MRLITLSTAAAAALFLTLTAAHASVVITVDKTDQRLSVSVDGAPRYSWPVSTARRGYRTPNGTYRPQRLERKWYSRTYHMSPMPYSIFFHGGYAIHGSYALSRLGTPASHGCIRLNPEHAAVLFNLVRREGASATRIIVTGHRPSTATARARILRQRQNRVARRSLPHERYVAPQYEPYRAPGYVQRRRAYDEPPGFLPFPFGR